MNQDLAVKYIRLEVPHVPVGGSMTEAAPQGLYDPVYGTSGAPGSTTSTGHVSTIRIWKHPGQGQQFV